MYPIYRERLHLKFCIREGEREMGRGKLYRANSLRERYRNGWGASIADALTTAILMEMKDVVETQLKFISTVDFTMSHTSDAVSLFETTV